MQCKANRFGVRVADIVYFAFPAPVFQMIFVLYAIRSRKVLGAPRSAQFGCLRLLHSSRSAEASSTVHRPNLRMAVACPVIPTPGLPHRRRFSLVVTPSYTAPPLLTGKM